MKLSLPKSNVSWTVQTSATPWGDTRLTAEFVMPGGEILRHSAAVNPMAVDDADYMKYVVRSVLEDMAREVGRKMVGLG